MNIIFQHPVVLLSDLICRGSLEFATSCGVRKLLVRHVVTFLFLQVPTLQGHNEVDTFMQLLQCVIFYSSLFSNLKFCS
jgi:hypothetical protein